MVFGLTVDVVLRLAGEDNDEEDDEDSSESILFVIPALRKTCPAT